MTSLLDFLRGSQGDGRFVPPSKLTGRLTLAAAAAMSFLAVFALVLTMAAHRQAALWGQTLAGTATVRIASPHEPEQVQAALVILETTTGVNAARILSEDEHAALLAPWLGPDLPLQDLPLPSLIEVELSPDGIDTLGLNLRLQAEVPSATFDDHSRWRAPLIDAAKRMRNLGWAALGLTFATLAVMVALSTQSALASNKQEIDVLHLVGAEDRFIARAFVWRFTGRAVAGALLGTGLGIIATLLLPNDPAAGSFLTALPPNGLGWLVPFLVVPLVAAVAYLATRVTVMRLLKETTL
ncbi:cell division protein FtsX [Actibacterium pelagium]|uniref:Cell division protein FtsX n=1 Tax=Actibacterium pelagium TaxID=2029103 RepID=A0A917EJ43_9RHOB|nr:FtsX-like permease family protein [Actibacterium pelagium]GGE51510.1 cell division protein FtsX [Actibacterium pelagium]